MDQRTIQILFTLFRSAICETKLTESERENYSADMLQDLLKISAKHDVIHLLVFGLNQNKLIPQDYDEIEKYILKAVYRYERLRYEYDNLCDALEKAQIPFLPLKGSVIRNCYPEAWMRTSCDIDILVHDEDIDRAREIMVDKCKYTYQGKGSHDISLFSPTNIHVELHYDLVGDGRVNVSSNVLKDIWNASRVRDGYGFWYEMSDDMFYFYHIAHMAKHFVNGGCGIRPIIDLWILDNMSGVDKTKRDELLEQGELLKFANSVRGLSGVWFDGLQHNGITKQMEGYILHGGVYGSAENYVAVQQQKKGGKLRYAFSKIFLPYDVIKYHYPILEKHKWMTPIMEIRRWCKLIFCGHLTRSVNELRYSGTIKNEQGADMLCFLENIGL